MTVSLGTASFRQSLMHMQLKVLLAESSVAEFASSNHSCLLALQLQKCLTAKSQGVGPDPMTLMLARIRKSSITA